MNENSFFNADIIREALGILKPNNELFEVRIIRGKENLSGYFRDAEKLIEQLALQDLTNANVYFTIQRIHEGCEARRQWDRFMEVGRANIPATSDKDAVGYSFIPIDLDPVRPAGVSSTAEELAAAEELSGEVIAYMTANGYTRYIKAMSGNGYHLLFPVAFPTLTEEERNATSDQVKRLLQTLDQYFSNDRCHVDTTVYNPSRIWKLYGTLAQKGRHTSDRPFRMAKILEVVGSAEN